MSYADTRCPCGNRRKQRDTMICGPCEAFIAGTWEAATYLDGREDLATRRAAAIKILTACRIRSRSTKPKGLHFIQTEIPLEA